MILGDTHAAQGDSELAGTAMETSMTTKLKVTLHKADALPALVQTLTGPLLETYDSFVITGYAVPDYLAELADNPSSIFSEGASVDSALADAFMKTRTFLMNYFEVTEEEAIVLMSTSVDFGITQIVDGNWGVHAIIPKWVFDGSEEAFDYSCTQNPEGTMTSGRRRLSRDSRTRKLQEYGVADPETAAENLFKRVTAHRQDQARAREPDAQVGRRQDPDHRGRDQALPPAHPFGDQEGAAQVGHDRRQPGHRGGGARPRQDRPLQEGPHLSSHWCLFL